MVRTHYVLRNEVIELDGEAETFARVVVSFHPLAEGGEAVAMTAIHRQDFARRIGGVRIVDETSIGGEKDQLREVGKLARGMTWKAALAGIPADGQKTVVTAPNAFAENAEDGRKAELLADHLRIVTQEDSGVIFGPDMNVGEPVQDALSEHSDLLDHVTGLSESKGGLSIDVNGYTGLGLFVALRTAVRDGSLAGMSAGIQGFGAVGAHTARLLHEEGVRVRAVNTKNRMIVASGEDGLDIPSLFSRFRSEKDKCLDEYSAPGVTGGDNPNEIFTEPMDLFVPSARTGVLATVQEIESGTVENRHAADVEKFLDQSGVRVIAEGANAPLTAAAESLAEEKNVLVLPDYAVNSGGLIGCWREWEVRHRLGEANESTRSTVAAIAEDTKNEIRQVVGAVVRQLIAEGAPYRAAAHRMAERCRRDLLDVR